MGFNAVNQILPVCSSLLGDYVQDDSFHSEKQIVIGMQVEEDIRNHWEPTPSEFARAMRFAYKFKSSLERSGSGAEAEDLVQEASISIQNRIDVGGMRVDENVFYFDEDSITRKRMTVFLQYIRWAHLSEVRKRNSSKNDLWKLNSTNFEDQDFPVDFYEARRMGPEEATEFKELVLELTRCYELLPSKLREVFSLRFYENMTTTEISELLEKTRRQTYSLLQRARASIMKCMTKKGLLE